MHNLIVPLAGMGQRFRDKGYNNNGWIGGALLIPTSQPLSRKENRSQMERMFPNTYNQ